MSSICKGETRHHPTNLHRKVHTSEWSLLSGVLSFACQMSVLFRQEHLLIILYEKVKDLQLNITVSWDRFLLEKVYLLLVGFGSYRFKEVYNFIEMNYSTL